MKKLNILIVDDSLEVRDYIKEILERDYYKISTLSYPEEIIRYDKNIDLLLTDLCFKDNKGNKKNKDGFYIIDTLKKKYPELPIILMSSGLNNIIRDRCKSIGVKTFPKYEDDKTPVNKKKLLNAIEDYL